ncbi:MAG TPA: cytochrome c oxidase subunit II [Rhodocyclaceae bacterium]|nr:cytochrome c oxidase subunit II [Rhodocyclaceae bacterium]
MTIQWSVKRWIAGVAVALFGGAVQAAWDFTMREPATKLARDILDLHNLMMTIIVVVFVVVFGLLSYSMYAHRKSRGHQAASFHESTGVEVAWTVVPFVVLVGMMIPATKTVLAMRDSSQPDITVKATGSQWKWGYDYLKGQGEGIHYLSVLATPREQIDGGAPKGEHYLLEVDRPLVVPVGRKIRVLTTATDVIHSWAIPELAIKQDAIPGFVRDTSFRAEREGVFRGQCTELCGKDHGFMPVVVEVVSAEKYDKWVEDQQKLIAAAAGEAGKTWALDELKARGAKVYTANCVPCHQATGRGIPGAFPALDGSKVVLGPTAGQIGTVLNGRPGTAMAAFGKQLGDTDIAAVITYTRNTWSNKTGEAVQPAEIKAARAK